MVIWMAKLDSKHKAVLIGIGLLLATVLLYIGIIAPQRERVTELLAQYQIEYQRVRTIEEYVQKHPDLEQYIRDTDMKVSQVEAKLPNQSEIGGCLKEIEQAAKLCSVTLLEIKPLAAVNKNGYREIPIEIQIKASFGNLLEFTKKLGGLQRYNTLTGINVQSKQGILDVKLSLSMYSYGVSPGTDLPQASQPPAKK